MTMAPDVETRRRFVTRFVPLSLWYVRRLHARGECATGELPDVLTRKVNLYRLTALWDDVHDPAAGYVDERWNALCASLAAMIAQSPLDGTEVLEREGLALMQPLLEARLPRDVGTPPPRPFGCWDYQLAWEGMADGAGLLGKLANVRHVAARVRSVLGLPPAPKRDVALHFDNVIKPLSPFDDMPALAAALRALLADVRARAPAAEFIWFHSWLNGHPQCRRLFPPGFAESGINRGVVHYQSWWGQFMTKTGDFNERIARRFRDSDGVFPFPGLLCHGRIVAVEDHLSKLAAQLAEEAAARGTATKDGIRRAGTAR
jgi:hypothetical protein